VWEIRVLLLWIIWVLGFGVSSYEEQNRIVETQRETKRKDRDVGREARVIGA
jgi:hypothetical protein